MLHTLKILKIILIVMVQTPVVDIGILKSRLCGFLVGDGSVFIRKEKKTGKVHHELRFYPDNLVLAKIFLETFDKVYGRKCGLRSESNGKYFMIYINCKNAILDLLSLSKFKSTKWTLPKNMKSREAKVEWLRAYFDCDGYVGPHYIQAQSVNGGGLKKVQNLLSEFGISSKMYVYHRKEKSWNTNYLLNINRKEMKLRFLKEIGFNHPLKRKKLENIMNAEVA